MAKILHLPTVQKAKHHGRSERIAITYSPDGMIPRGIIIDKRRVAYVNMEKRVVISDIGERIPHCKPLTKHTVLFTPK